MRALVCAVAVLVVGCAATLGTPPPATRSLGPGEIWLPVVDTRGGTVLCAGGGPVGSLAIHGSPSDPRVTWMALSDGTAHPVVWMPGTSARFTPDLEVIGPDGRVIAREGDQISGSCSMPNGALVEFGTGADAEGT
jgi:hypothetical protein